MRCVVWQSGFGGGVGWVGQQEGRVQWQFRFGCMEQWAVGSIGLVERMLKLVGKVAK